MVIHWASSKQSIVSISSCEAELNANVTGVKLGIGIRNVLNELLQEEVPMRLIGGNLEALMSITTEVTSWRSRHYAMRAAWIRDMVRIAKIEVAHERGTTLVSDASTKVLERTKLKEARQRLGLVQHDE